MILLELPVCCRHVKAALKCSFPGEGLYERLAVVYVTRLPSPRRRCCSEGKADIDTTWYRLRCCRSILNPWPGLRCDEDTPASTHRNGKKREETTDGRIPKGSSVRETGNRQEDKKACESDMWAMNMDIESRQRSLTREIRFTPSAGVRRKEM